MVMVGRYFSRHRALAAGLAMSGGSVGQLVIPQIIDSLLSEYGFSGTMLIYSAFALHAVLAGALLRPQSFYKGKAEEIDPKEDEEAQTELDKGKLGEKSKDLTEIAVTEEEIMKEVTHEPEDQTLVTADINVTQESKDQTQNGTPKAPKPEKSTSRRSVLFNCSPLKIVRSIFALFDRRLLCNSVFIIYTAGCAMANCGYIDQFLFIPPYGEQLGIDRSKIAFTLSASGAADLMGRIFGGVLANLKLLQTHHFMCICLIGNGISTMICTMLPSYPSFLAQSIVLGLIGGSYIALFPVVLIDFLGLQVYSRALGLAMFFIGSVNLGLPAMFGKILYQLPAPI